MPRPVPLTPEQRSLAARVAAYASHVDHPRGERLAAARTKNPACVEYWERQLAAEYPGLDPAEIHRRARLKVRERMARLTLASSKARAARKAAGR